MVLVCPRLSRDPLVHLYSTTQVYRTGYSLYIVSRSPLLGPWSWCSLTMAARTCSWRRTSSSSGRGRDVRSVSRLQHQDSNFHNVLKVYIVLTPAFEGRITGKSLPAYGRMGQVIISFCEEVSRHLLWWWWCWDDVVDIVDDDNVDDIDDNEDNEIDEMMMMMMISGFPDQWSRLGHFPSKGSAIRDQQLSLNCVKKNKQKMQYSLWSIVLWQLPDIFFQ